MADTQELKFKILASVVGAEGVKSLQNDFNALKKNSDAITGALKTLGVAFGLKQIVGFGESLLEVGDSLFKLSQKTGVSVESLAKLREQAELADVPFDALTGGLRKLSVNLVEASTGNEEMAAAFKAAGVSIRDSGGQLKNAGQVVSDLQKKFSTFQDGPQKAALAVKLFGRSGSELIPLLDDSSESVGRLAAAIDTDFASRAQVFNDTLKTIGNNAKAAGIDGLKVLLPTLQELGNAFADFGGQGSDFVGVLELFGEAVRVLANGIVVTFNGMTSAIDLFVTGVLQMGDALSLDMDTFSKRGTDAMDRLAKRAKETYEFVNRTTKNSLLFSGKTVAQARADQIADTKPADAKPKGPTPDTDGTGNNAKIVKEFEAKIAKMRAEAATYGLSNAAKEQAVLLAELESKGLKTSSAAYQNLAAKIKDAVNARETAKEIDSAKQYAKAQQDDIDLKKLELDYIGKSTIEYQKAAEAKRIDNDVRKATEKFTAAGAAAYKEEAERIKEERLALIDLEQQQKQTYSTGARQALQEYLENARDVASQVKNMFQTAFGNIEDSLVNFVKTGKLNFKQFADDVISDLIRIQVKALIVQAITGIAGAFGGGGSTSYAPTGGGTQSYGLGANTQFANGGIMTERGSLPLKKYANGGIARSPQLAMFGEGRTPEAYVPLPDGRSIPVTMQQGQGGQGGMIVNVTVNSQTGEAEASGTGSDKQKDFGRALAEACKNVIRNEMRPGGMLA